MQFELGKTGKEMEAKIADGLSDIRFTDTNRVPFPFQTMVSVCECVRGCVTGLGRRVCSRVPSLCAWV